MGLKYLIKGKSFVLFTFFQFYFTLIAAAQTNGDFRSRQDGVWTNSLCWEIFSNGNWINSSYSPSQLDGHIQVRHTIQIGSDQVMDQVLLDTGATLSILPGVTVTVTNSPDAQELILRGTLINSGMCFFSPSSIMYIDSGGTYIHNSSIASSSVLDASSMHAQSNWVYRGNGTLAPPVSISNRHYGNLIFESTAGNWNRSITGTGSSSCTSLSIGINVMIINNYTGILSIHGNLSLQGSLVNGSGTQKIVLDGTTALLSGNNLNSFYDQLSIPSSANYSLLNNMTTSASSSLTVYGILNCNSSVIDGNNNGSSFFLKSDAWLKTGHSFGITSSITAFTQNNFSDSANIEFSGNGNQDVILYNPTLNNLRINAVAGTQLRLKNNIITITGALELMEGLFSVDSNTINFKGKAISGQSNNLLTTIQSSLIFTGGDSSTFIPAAILQLKNLTINKTTSHVLLNSDIHIYGTLTLTKGKINTGIHTIYSEGTIANTITGGSDSSFISGKLCRSLSAGDSINIVYPIGKSLFEPIEFSNLKIDTMTKLLVEVFETTPNGTSDSISLTGMLMNRFWNLKTVGLNRISRLEAITVYPTNPNPPLQQSSRLAYSADNSSLSFHGLGGIIGSNFISNQQGLSSCQLNDLNSTDGSFISVAIEANQGGVYIDSNCVSLLKIKLFIQGFYNSNQSMRATIDPNLVPGICDSVNVELHAITAPYNLEYNLTGLLDTAGNINLVIPYLNGQSFYIVVKHRNSLETWSSFPIVFNNPITIYDFSSAAGKAYGNNQVEIEPGIFAIASGDISSAASGLTYNQDGIIDRYDLNYLENEMLVFNAGNSSSDLTGDNMLELSDYSLLENNLSLLLHVLRP